MMGKKVALRIHPQEFGREDNYIIDESVCSFGRPEYPSVCFGHTSTMLNVCLAQGILTLKYRSDVPSNEYCEDLMFSDAQEILRILGSVEDVDPRSLAEPYIKYIGDEASRKYSEFFASLE